MFALSGATQASWMSRLPPVLEQTQADFVRFGAALLMLGLGTLTAMLLTGAACDRFGSRRVLIFGFAVTLAALPAIALSRSAPALAMTLLVMGLGSGAWDAGMNVQGHAVESRLDKHLMSRFHGWWSVGSMAGAGLGLAAARFAVPLLPHLATVGVLTAVLCALSLRTFGDAKDSRPDESRPHPRWPLRRLLPIGTLIFCGAIVEGAAGDWLAVFLNQERGLSHTGAALGYTLFVSAMAAGRLFAERPHRHAGAPGVVRSGAIAAGLSITLVVFADTGSWAFIGALGWGVGICWVFPAALSAAGNAATSSAVAGMTAVGYSASIFGPLGLGWLAHTTGLGPALLTLLPLALAVALLAPSLATRTPAD
ncbi:MFS transporter [Paractinoplanes lichenicola]|uniref:MFS transporter n=1 Tax=Paractinoplanes lichenicola TaxID=2802976 RepID=A0ABS1W5S8_9ACTN|nr:MFS transporter [Actinoplanes lichenicola]MBL7262085.1 MFS transporter [Actinoplanes lichenicola]